MIIVLAHYNTYRKSPHGGTWQDTIFGCLSKLPNMEIIVVDWGSEDGSNISTKKICGEYGYKYREISDNVKSEQFSWFEYFSDWINIISNEIGDEKNILYIEADTYICGDEKQLLEAESILDNNDIGLVRMTRVDPDGLTPMYIDKKINNGFVLPKLSKLRKFFKYEKNDIELLSSRTAMRRAWNNWSVQCSLFKFDCLLSSFEETRKAKCRKDKKRGFANFGFMFINKHNCAIGDYIFAYNYGASKVKTFEQAKLICDRHWDKKIIDICKESILKFKE